MARHERFSEHSRRIEEMVSQTELRWTENRPEVIDRYPGDDALLAYEYRLAWQVIACHREAMLEEELEADVPGLDTPISQLAQEAEARHCGEYQSEEQFREFVENLISLACDHEADA
jgi:hypothetical protein